ncbi:MAG: GDP-mannose 4,6-dehydratase [Bacteroidia bacterium]|nr:GDP-mannose 4,6-dehydratase [Bacteroidia bacterium]
MSQKKIFVTGVAGFLGSNLLKKLIYEGHTVVGLDNLSMGKMSNIEEFLNHDRFTFIQGDITEESTYETLDRDFDSIVHLAAFKIPRYGKAVDTLLINAKGTENILNYARDTKTKCVLASTSDVYGNSPELPFREDGIHVIGDSKVPRWAYAVSKLFDEHLGLAYMDAYDFPVTLLRFFGSYGPNQHLSWWGGPQPVFIDCLLQGKPIPIHGDGSQTRTFTYVDDTVAGIYAATVKDEANGEIFNIGANKEITILGLAQLLHKISGRPGEVNVEFIPYDQISQGRKYQDVMRRVPDTTKLERMLGVKAQVDIEDGMRRTFEWQRSIFEKQTV